jgi:hypothetical protein
MLDTALATSDVISASRPGDPYVAASSSRAGTEPTAGKTAACTIISRNYLPYARVLHASLQKHNPECKFYVLMVDEEHGSPSSSCPEKFEVINVQSLNIPRLEHVAFRYNILELNTNVKPSFMAMLLSQKGVEKLLYFDPDILICNSLAMLFELLDDVSILLTPHCTSPINDDFRPNEQDFLLAGVFNLGFIGLRNSGDTATFLAWWENRCLNLGFNELRMGLFVDQKWVNLVPCFFDSVFVTRHLGCNMAYWNLHERTLSESQGQLRVNGDVPLIFFHFSGIDPADPAQLSKHSNRHLLARRPDLANLFRAYRNQLFENGYESSSRNRYGFGFYSNGNPVTQIARAAFAVSESHFRDDNPFLASSEFYRWARSRGILSLEDTHSQFNSSNHNQADLRVRVARVTLSALLKVVGPNRYTILMKYLSFISVLRNQAGVLSPK